MKREEDRACDSCQRPLYKATGALRCQERRMVTACSNYCGPFREYHIPLKHGMRYADGLSREKGTKTVHGARLTAHGGKKC